MKNIVNMKKKCNVCKIFKPISEYYIRKNDLISYCCRTCHKLKCKEYSKKNKDKIIKRIKEWAINNKSKTRENKTKWRRKNPNYHKNYYRKRLSEDSEYNTKNYIKNIEACRESARKFRKNNPKHNQEYCKKRRKIDNCFRLATNLRTRIRYAIKYAKGTKALKCFDLTGCNLKELKLYLESKFLPTMSWDNYGKYWQVDHVIPCVKFDLTKEEE